MLDVCFRCCKIHDDCYGALTEKKTCLFTLWQYLVPYSFTCNKETKKLECHKKWWVTPCGFEVCKCDLELTKCWSKFEKPEKAKKGRKPNEVCYPPTTPEAKA
ncbi:hypothetical protein AB6A40_011411 [Gnathostoma spinigerum]|uniref:Phospholipase A2-like central domain-containing protein n=1 Tax=Gnathostoma spinigerum TaxID=75299 RepID=A0ABD6EZU0_9BILA